MERDALAGDCCIEQWIENLAFSILWQVDNGWPRKQAEAFMVITCSLKAPLAAAMRDRSDPDPAVRARSDRYAASTRIVCDVLAQRAKQMTKPAPLLYMNLTGLYGLATNDPAWAALMQPERECRPRLCHEWPRVRLA